MNKILHEIHPPTPLQGGHHPRQKDNHCYLAGSCPPLRGVGG